MDGLLLPRTKEMGEIMEAKIRKKDKVMSGRAGVVRGGISAVKSQAGSCVHSARRTDEE